MPYHCNRLPTDTPGILYMFMFKVATLGSAAPLGSAYALLARTVDPCLLLFRDLLPPRRSCLCYPVVSASTCTRTTVVSIVHVATPILKAYSYARSTPGTSHTVDLPFPRSPPTTHLNEERGIRLLLPFTRWTPLARPKVEQPRFGSLDCMRPGEARCDFCVCVC